VMKVLLKKYDTGNFSCMNHLMFLQASSLWK
jgi:hypothetical protein